MGIIKVLEQHVADKIAAGEVVERPLSVAKELLENSLDAGASIIEITLKDGGLQLVRVKDNGSGMNQEDMLVAFERHATSKITDFGDLYRLHSFGFRGEALASIAAVSQIEMISKTAAADMGYKVTMTPGRPAHIEAIGSDTGTTLDVKNLFFNIPARRKFLKSKSYESSLIHELVMKYALGYQKVIFKLYNNDQMLLDTSGVVTVTDRLQQVYGKELEEHIIAIPRQEILPNVFLQAWLVREEFHRNNRTHETVFVNGRLIKNQEINLAIEEGYYTLLAKGRFPIAVVLLDVPTANIDVNIHPAKTEIKIHDFFRIRENMVALFKDALWAASITRSSQKLSGAIISKHDHLIFPAKPAAPSDKMVALPSLSVEKDWISEDRETNYYQATSSPMPIAIVKETAAEARQPALDFPTAPLEKIIETHFGALERPLVNSETDKETVAVKNLQNLQLLGQLNNSFILAANQDGLYIIDQHTCHERIMYDRFMKSENEKEVISESLLIPLKLSLGPREEGELVNHILKLRDLGFIVEKNHDGHYALQALPQGLSEIIDIEQFFLDLLHQMGEREITMADIKEDIITMSSCKSAVKANMSLSEVEMLTLLNDLSHVDNAHTCPHGRPITYYLSMQDLYRIFQRGTYRR